jgi:hypothetical protein
MLPFCHLFSPVPHSLRRLLYWEDVGGGGAKAAWKASQGKGKGKKGSPQRSPPLQCFDGEDPQSTNPPPSSSTPAKPSQPYNTMHQDTVPRSVGVDCHGCHSHGSYTFSPRKAIFNLKLRPSQTTAGRPAIKPYGGLLLSACISGYPSPPVLQSAVSRKMLTTACPRRRTIMPAH